MKINNTRAGALLFAVITAFILTLVVSTLVILTSNQYRIIDREIDRITAFYRLQAGMEYSTWQSYSNANWLSTAPHTVNIAGKNVNIGITTPAPGNISTYQVTLSTDY